MADHLPCIRGLGKVKDLLLELRRQKLEHNQTFENNDQDFLQARSPNDHLITRSRDILRLFDHLKDASVSPFAQSKVVPPPEQEPPRVSRQLDDLRMEVDKLCRQNMDIAQDNKHLEETAWLLIERVFQKREALQRIRRERKVTETLTEENVMLEEEAKLLEQSIGKRKLNYEQRVKRLTECLQRELKSEKDQEKSGRDELVARRITGLWRKCGLQGVEVGKVELGRTCLQKEEWLQ